MKRYYKQNNYSKKKSKKNNRSLSEDDYYNSYNKGPRNIRATEGNTYIQVVFPKSKSKSTARHKYIFNVEGENIKKLKKGKYGNSYEIVGKFTKGGSSTKYSSSSSYSTNKNGKHKKKKKHR